MRIPIHIQQELPGVATAFDESSMRGHLQAALFGAARPGFTVERCTPNKPLYVPGECCTVQYEFEARDNASGALQARTVVGRVFPDAASCAAYMSDKLTPLVARIRGRADVAMFAEPAAVIEPLNMIVHAWPIDGELPTLVDATDPRRMIEVFRETLEAAPEQRFAIQDCAIEPVSYRRRQRCVLRYTLTGRAAGSHEPRRLVVYGKLTPHGREALDGPILAALHAYIQQGRGHRFTVPRSLGWRPDLRLALLEAVPGEAKIGSALRARLKAQPPPDAPPLEELITTCGRVAATLHTSGLELGPARTLRDRLEDLQLEVAITREFAPEFAGQAQAWLEAITAHAEQSQALPPCLCHGDFKYAQLLFDGGACGMVDFDTICQAEPALDLGQFLAYLRTQVQKTQKRPGGRSALDEELGEQFLRAYVEALGDRAEDEPRLRARTTVHEVVSLLRMALHSRQKFKDVRLDSTTVILEQRLSRLPRPPG